MILPLIHNASLLLTLVLLHDVVVSSRRGAPSLGGLVFSGIILGSIGVAISLTPLHFSPGIIYDTRSVLISVSGLFLGTIPTLLAMLITAFNRLFIVGGVGAWTGTSVVFASGGIALLWRRCRRESLEAMSRTELFLFGVIVHIVMLLLMLTLPGDLGWKVLSGVAVPVIVIYPTITMLLGALLVNRLCQKDARIALQASEERLRATLYSIADAVITTDCDCRVLQMNPVAETLTGWGENEARRKPLSEIFRIVHERTRQPVEGPVDAVLRQGAGIGLTGQALLLSRDGRETPIADSAAPIRNEEGTMIGVVLVFRSQAAERAMEKERVMLTETIRASMNEIYIIDVKSGEFRFANQGALANLGYTFEQLCRLGPVALNPAFTPDTFERFVTPLLTREKQQLIIESTHHRADGSRYPVEVHLQLIDHEDDRVLLAIAEDITAKKQAEEKARLATEEASKLQEQLLHAQKMESVGRLAGGVAHDFNNMLGVIIGHADLAMCELEAGSRVTNSLQEIRRAAEHSAGLTRQLLAFARKQTIKPRPIDLNETVTSSLKMLRRLIGESIQLVFNPGSNLWVTKMDPAQLDQVLANLAVNARDAISGSGVITIRTTNELVDKTRAASFPDVRAGEYVALSITDTGCGMDESTLGHLFEPFFTTKKLGEGTGLGLATLYGIVRQNDGFVTVESAPGQGSVFSVYLPRDRSEPPHPAAEGIKSAASGSETILLVEDEAELLKLMKTALEGKGYTVLATGSPRQAISLIGEHAGLIDLLVTDVVMPEMNGRELKDRVLALRGNMKVLYISGYTADVIARHGVLEGDVMLLEKPFTIGDLAAKVRSVLDARSDHLE